LKFKKFSNLKLSIEKVKVEKESHNKSSCYSQIMNDLVLSEVNQINNIKSIEIILSLNFI